jgi:hypothetical protein
MVTSVAAPSISIATGIRTFDLPIEVISPSMSHFESNQITDLSIQNDFVRLPIEETKSNTENHYESLFKSIFSFPIEWSCYFKCLQTFI